MGAFLLDGAEVKCRGEVVGRVVMHRGVIMAEANGEALGVGYRSKFKALVAVKAAVVNAKLAAVAA